MLNQSRFFLPAIGWVILSTVLMTLPASAFPREKWYTQIPMFDKWVHLGLFGVMAVLLCWGVYKEKKSRKLKQDFIRMGVICLIYGITMEFVQRFLIPNRSFDIGDIIADGAGAAGGVVYSVKAYIKK
ncbi:MAG: VanZ family protein [Chitinophagaceae bacterium]